MNKNTTIVSILLANLTININQCLFKRKTIIPVFVVDILKMYVLVFVWVYVYVNVGALMIIYT